MKPTTFSLTFCALLPATAALADRIDMPAPVSSVILYPQGASVTRTLQLSAPAGQHDLVIPGLPVGTDPAALRIQAENLTLGSVQLQSARALPDHAPESPAILAARDQLRAAEDALRDFDRAGQALRTRAEALRQRAQITRDLLQGDSRLPAAEIPDTVEQMGALIEDLLNRADEQDYQIAMREPDRQPLLDAIGRAQAELAALRAQVQQAQSETLVLTVQATDQPASVSITGFVPSAGWQPDYDLRLDRSADTLTMQRGVSVWQSSGEDWSDVALTLSTARPQSQTAPTEVPSWMPRFGQPDRDRNQRRTMEMSADMAGVLHGAPAMAAPIAEAKMSTMGVTVIYDYDGPVTIRDGVDALRLTLDDKALTPEVIAEAAPRFDDRAYLVAETVNTTGEPILPGPVTLYADGALVGRSFVDLTADGDDLRFGFGPIDGLQAELRLPEETEGESGLIRRQTTLHETATLIVRNLTAEEWPLRVVDRIPVSRQEQLRVDWSAEPEPSETDPDGRLGVLYWQAPIAAGDTREIMLTTDMRWPDGNELLD
ncbi:mucoidy inhibitor MuiA family protein [Paracoccus sp. M683]|uniref:DUF4139 domain-containing protein n=1 Tax=Paracoccus sp. M683 TaxID=2594268 RepID=UPI0011815D3C|nr:DUF4139 domain-containing protein [Paracoccus sp. M683]TRW98856.1 mucoidy inhibitor MuiA family protein [Paracoccus sp. M683]